MFAGKHYSHALFFCHLCLEKLLKAVVVQKTKKQSPYIHDLLTLAQMAEMHLDKAQENQLNDITAFNVRARYDDVKCQFYKKATKAYGEKYLVITKKSRIWLKRNYLKE